MFTLRDIKTALRNGKYAWPGGYPVFFVTSQGDVLSYEAVRANWRRVCESHIKTGDRCWDVCGVDINWEDPELYCCETGERIESAYAEPD